ncbi:MAG TPA: archaellin/type IV pilin N-terminal domain-containing protein [Methanoregula sp.]|nr:archaellin/type IV pilin N-terminal domain-containing protein [Methanoregula sp.]
MVVTPMHKKNSDNAFTGLEAAIVLIAFVVVAAVFSYVVLGAGFFTTQKSQEVVHTGVSQASSTLEIVGNVYGVAPGATGSVTDQVKFVNFSVALAPGGTPVDFDKVVLVFSNASTLVTLANITGATVQGEPSGAGTWSIPSIQNAPQANPTDLLQPNEQFTISIWVPGGGIPRNDVFNIEIRPSIGAAFDIKRTVPAAVNAVNILY